MTQTCLFVLCLFVTLLNHDNLEVEEVRGWWFRFSTNFCIVIMKSCLLQRQNMNSWLQIIVSWGTHPILSVLWTRNTFLQTDSDIEKQLHVCPWRRSSCHLFGPWRRTSKNDHVAWLYGLSPRWGNKNEQSTLPETNIASQMEFSVPSSNHPFSRCHLRFREGSWWFQPIYQKNASENWIIFPYVFPR